MFENVCVQIFEESFRGERQVQGELQEEIAATIFIKTKTKTKMATGGDETDVEPQDLELLSKWVKKRLFGMVKFVYRPSVDLKVDGDLFWLFVGIARTVCAD
jgi:hypothetical protein